MDAQAFPLAKALTNVGPFADGGLLSCSFVKAHWHLPRFVVTVATVLRPFGKGAIEGRF